LTALTAKCRETTVALSNDGGAQDRDPQGALGAHIADRDRRRPEGRPVHADRGGRDCGAVYSLFAGLVVDREIKPNQLFRLFYRAAETTAVIMFLVSAAGVSAWLISAANIPQQLADLVAPLMHNKVLLAPRDDVGLVVGTALDFTSTVRILMPMLMPILKQAGRSAFTAPSSPARCPTLRQASGACSA
jgi:hypothetical protein